MGHNIQGLVRRWGRLVLRPTHYTCDVSNVCDQINFVDERNAIVKVLFFCPFVRHDYIAHKAVHVYCQELNSNQVVNS